jgi:EAL domain-containing protein (putative c-di-GMP-specific phosphodiesterase class I)
MSPIGRDGRGADRRPGPRIIGRVRFLTTQRRPGEERLLWSRDIRFVRRLAALIDDARILELDTGTVLVAPAAELTDSAAAQVARLSKTLEYGLVTVDDTLPERDRYLVAMSAAVQLSGIADRIGMAQSPQVVQMKTLDYFFSLRKVHSFAYQPIVRLATGELYEYECLFRPQMPMLPQSIASIVQAAISTDRGVELDSYIIATGLASIERIEVDRRSATLPPLRYALNLMPSSLLDAAFEPAALSEHVRAANLDPRQLTIECTEQQSVSDVGLMQRRVRALRRLGFGFAVDDAGAGYASFALIAALRPSVIKIDRDVVHGVSRNDAKQALIEAFVSFGRRIGAHLLAEGIERRADLAALQSLGVELGQGYLLGRPAAEPRPPRRMEPSDGRIAAVRRASKSPGGAAATTHASPRPVGATGSRPRVPSRA